MERKCNTGPDASIKNGEKKGGGKVRVNRPEPWQTAETPGPEKALVITKPEIVAALLKRAKHPIMIVGHGILGCNLGKEEMIDYVIRLARLSGVTVVATSHIVKEFVEKGFQPAVSISAIEIADRLRDPSWKGFEGNGQYDLAIFLGFPYYMEWLILSGLKNFSPDLKTVSLDKFYQPNASWSFPNISTEEWINNLNAIEKEFRKR
jgi:acetyl-CoA decarbonylase/synthase complex subunit epsilon